MRGLLLDANIQNHQAHLTRLLDGAGLLAIIAEFGLHIANFVDLRIPLDVDDRKLWTRCQELRLVLLTENRNQDGPDSLQETLDDSWNAGCLPVLTLANKRRFERDTAYAESVANDIADVLFGIVEDGEFLNIGRIWIPRLRI